MSRAPAHERDASAPWANPPEIRRIVLRLRPLPDGLPALPYQDGIETFLVRHGLAPEWPGIANDFQGVTIKRVFVTLAPERIAELQAAAMRMRPGELDNLLLFFSVDAPSKVAHELLARIQSMQVVEEAYLESPPTPPPSLGNPAPALLVASHVDPAPVGIGARAVQATNANARGQGMQFADIEQGWHIYKEPNLNGIVNHDHLLPQPVVMDDGWGGKCQHLWSHPHGTRSIGVIRANAVGGHEGIAPDSTGFCVCEVRPETGVLGRADAILTTASHLHVGDVMLLEMQMTDGSTNLVQQWPVEIETANRAAISVATAIGIVVIEATGNGPDSIAGVAGLGDLDTKFQALRRGTQGFLDSGAVLVAGASSAAPHVRLAATRYGSRVDCYAWGENVVTTDSVALLGQTCAAQAAPAAGYSSSFDGSSSASAIVAGAALVVQSIHKGTYGFPASAWQVRDLLKVNGTLPANGLMDRIGVMPNLVGIADAIVPKQQPQIYLRDHVGDTGAPHNGPSSNSPDIIVRRAPVPNAAVLYGQGGGHENDDTLSRTVLAGQEHTLYVRLLNNANVASGPVSVNVYWSEVGTLITPSEWHHIGTDHLQPSVVVPNVPPGDILTVSGPIRWLANEVPSSGHYCFVALVGCPGDPAVHPLSLDNDWAKFYAFIQNNNNITWHNFTVVDPPMLVAMHAGGIPFIVAGARDRRVRMALEIASDLPPDLRPMVKIPGNLEEIIGRLAPHPRPRVRPDGTRVDHGFMRLGAAEFPASGRWTCRLRLDGPQSSQPVRGEIAIRQLCLDDDREVEVGRVTWRFTG